MESKMIATYSKLGQNGRLGNSMFQIATTINYALENKMKFSFPKWKYSKYMQKSLPEEVFEIKHLYNESNFGYTSIPTFDDNVDLFGYFQSEKYFKNHFFEIQPYLILNSSYERYIWRQFGRYLHGKTCSIHVRRNDYLINPVTKEFHGVLPIEYYELAISVVYKKGFDDICFMICSDDIPWCKEKFHLPNMVFVEGEEDIIDLFVMSYCDNNIIINSSFSWWIGFLNVMNRDKKIIAPKNWFIEKANQNTKDLYCEGWIVI